MRKNNYDHFKTFPNFHIKLKINNNDGMFQLYLSLFLIFDKYFDPIIKVGEKYSRKSQKCARLQQIVNCINSYTDHKIFFLLKKVHLILIDHSEVY